MTFFGRSGHYEPLPNTASVANDSFEVERERALEGADTREEGDSPLLWSGSIYGRGTWRAILDGTLERCRSFVQRNAGLLLVGSSQAFFALMNVFVKILNSLDSPISALQVSCRFVT